MLKPVVGKTGMFLQVCAPPPPTPHFSPLHTETLILATLAYHLPPLGKTEIELRVIRSEGVRNVRREDREAFCLEDMSSVGRRGI